MPSSYRSVFGELRYEAAKVAFLNSFLSAALVFFASNVLLTLLHINFWYSLVPSVLVFLISFIVSMHRYTLRRFEEGNPEVKEMLRTASDNRNREGLMVHALFVELLEKLDETSAGVFINAKSTFLKLLLIAVLAFTPLIIVNYAPFLLLGEPLDLGIGGVARQAREVLAPVLPVEETPERDLTGERDIIALGNQKLDIKTASSQGGVDFNNPDSTQSRSFRYNDYPDEVSAEQTTAGTGGSLSDAELVNDYSCRVRGICPTE